MPEMTIKDVIIIGAGPAGSLAGYHLAKAGLDVLIIEKCRFPRRKVCGGGLTQHACRELPYDLSPVIHKQIDWAILGCHGRKVKEIHSDRPIAYLIDRASLDNFLLGQALQRGASVKLGQRVHTIENKGDWVSVKTAQGSYQTRYLIGADGVHSMVARTFGFSRLNPLSLVYEARLAYPLSESDTLLKAVTFDFGTHPFGYGWAFPKRDHINVGVFRSWPGRRTSQGLLQRFISLNPALRDLPILDTRAYPVPLGGVPQSIHNERVLLVGDAAQLADPWLGEGLYYAFISGRMAAETILGCENHQFADLSHYSEQINAALIPQFKAARHLSMLVYSLPFLNVLLLCASTKLQQIILDLLRGDRSYTRIWETLKTRVPSTIWKTITRQ